MGVYVNAAMGAKEIKKRCGVDEATTDLLRMAATRKRAPRYRTLDRKLWG